jgi:prophage regulatory protein
MSETLLRLWQILGCPKRGATPMIPISKSLWFEKVASGEFPKGILLANRTRVWTRSSIQAVIDRLAAQEKAL